MASAPNTAEKPKTGRSGYAVQVARLEALRMAVRIMLRGAVAIAEATTVAFESSAVSTDLLRRFSFDAQTELAMASTLLTREINELRRADGQPELSGAAELAAWGLKPDSRSGGVQ